MKKIFLTALIFSFVFFHFQNLFAQDNKDALSIIYNRKSVRTFTGEAVSKEDLDKILKAAMSAPSAMNKQPWSFVVISERKNIDMLADSLPNLKMLEKAGAVIIVCAIPEKAANGLTEFAVIDCTLAGENILLAIESLGLGGLWTAVYPSPERMNTLRSILGIPESVIPMNVIPIGHPEGETKPKDKFKLENIHWEKW